jgi:DNA polymerase-1
VSENIDRPILIVDVMNLFMRCYAAFPQMSLNGYQMGGCIGFLKTLRRLVNEMQPKAVYLAWEGGGSQRRRKIFPEYKLKRQPMRLNRFYGDDIPDSSDNEKHQVFVLLNMLKRIPVCQLYVSDCEGDDLIAYLCRKFASEQKIVASSDKDMYQLLDENTKVYSFHKKTFVTETDILTTFRVRAQNFALAKALCGDFGDNVPGIKGCGFKTVSKLYPFLGTESNVMLQDVIDYAASHKDESRIHKRVYEQQEDLRRNWSLVFLDGSMLSATQASSVDYVIASSQPKVDKMGFVKQLVKEGIGDFDVEGFFYAFNCIEGIAYKTGDD